MHPISKVLLSTQKNVLQYYQVLALHDSHEVYLIRMPFELVFFCVMQNVLIVLFSAFRVVAPVIQMSNNYDVIHFEKENLRDGLYIRYSFHKPFQWMNTFVLLT